MPREPLIAQGLQRADSSSIAPSSDGVLAQFDFGVISDVTAPSLSGAGRAIQAHPHPVRRSCATIRDFEIAFDSAVKGVTQDACGVDGRNRATGGRETPVAAAG